MADKYDDIINLPHWDPKNHPRMPMGNRAAQFAPFAALTGHDEAIRETARVTETRPELDSESAAILNEKLCVLMDCVGQQPEIEVTFFVNDALKTGGSCTVHKGNVRRMEDAGQMIVFTDGTRIQTASVCNMRGGVFSEIDNRE